MTVVERAYTIGAVRALRGDYANISDIARATQRSRHTIARLAQRVEERVACLGSKFWDELVYLDEKGCGRPTLLTQDQKDRIIALVTSTRKYREKQPWQAIDNSNFKEIVPQISTETFQNVMYEAGYGRHAPGWRPPLSKADEEERYEWAQKHNPDRDHEYDNQGFDWTTVAFTNETPARISDERGIIRTWCKPSERFDDSVKHDRNCRECCLQFYSCF